MSKTFGADALPEPVIVDGGMNLGLGSMLNLGKPTIGDKIAAIADSIQFSPLLTTFAERSEKELQLRAAFEKDPQNWRALYELAGYLYGKNTPMDTEAAKSYYVMALATKSLTDPIMKAQIHSDLSALFIQGDQLDFAISHGGSATVLDPNNGMGWYNFGLALFKRAQKYEEAQDTAAADKHKERALKVLSRASELCPGDFEIALAIGSVYYDCGEWQRALYIFESLAYQCTLVQRSFVFNKITSVLRRQGFYAAAVTMQQQVNSADLKMSDGEHAYWLTVLGTSRMQAFGPSPKAWELYDYRFQSTVEHVKDNRIGAFADKWDGKPIGSKNSRLTITAEQGPGDEIMYASCIDDAMALANADKYVITCDSRLVTLFQRSFPQATVRPSEGYSVLADLETFQVSNIDVKDYTVSIGSLPRYLRNSFESFEKDRLRYLTPDPEKVKEFESRYAGLREGGKKLVGISWRSYSRNGPQKSASLSGLLPFLQIAGIQWVSLQYGNAEQQAEQIKEVEQLQSQGVDILTDTAVDPMGDLDIVAAQYQALDLVITVSNTTAHLAGALGVPVWLMLPPKKGLMWYWFLERRGSPWYKSMTTWRSSPAIEEIDWWLHPGVVPAIREQLLSWAVPAQD